MRSAGGGAGLVYAHTTSTNMSPSCCAFKRCVALAVFLFLYDCNEFSIFVIVIVISIVVCYTMISILSLWRYFCC